MDDAPLSAVRILLVDDHPAVQEGLEMILIRYGLNVCGKATSRTQALALMAELTPDLLLVDLSLGPESGFDLLNDIQQSSVRTLVYTMHADTWSVRSALTAGANGYVTKQESAATLHEALVAVAAGRRYLSPEAEAALATPDPLAELWTAVENFSSREHDIFRLAGDGFSAPEIADTLAISVSTVETYISRIVAKLDCSGTKEMRRLAIQYKNTLPPPF